MALISEAGVDTTRFLFRLHDERQQLAAEQMWGRMPGKLGPLRVGWMPGPEVLWVEGRPRTLYGDATGLLAPDALGDAHGLVLEHLRDVGATSARAAGVSRLDATVTLSFERPSEGHALLQGLAALDVPRRKPDVIGRPPETVYWLTKRAGVRKERAYDKGLEAGTAPAGTQIRLEAQMRYQAKDRTTVEWWNVDRVREGFQHRFSAMAQAGEGLHVASEQTIREQLRDLAERGRITPGMAERLLGFIAAQSVGIRSPSRRTHYYRRAELRRLGLAQALDGIDDADLDVDLGGILADAVGAGCWNG